MFDGVQAEDFSLPIGPLQVDWSRHAESQYSELPVGTGDVR
jgi:hypothetical protein